MADKRISQLVERTDIANNDVVPIVASGATTTNKATISSIQEFMQENLDLGVTSVGITLGTTGTDVSVTGSPITTSGNITINLPTASATNRGLLSSADWTTFNNKQAAGNYVTLDTAQTITAQKTFTTSGSSDTMIISHGSGSGFALDVIKAGNGEAIRVQKTSGSGNAMTVIGGNFEAPTIVRTGGTSSQFLKANGSVDSSTYLTTSTAASTYVPYTGATGAVDLGTHTLSSNNLIANGGLNAGALLLKNANAASTINTGYLTLSPSSTTTRVTFGFSTGASTWKSLSFSSHLLTDNTPTIFSFPNGGGTLAVTTDLGAYLPLTGGTLTGALNGTSAVFSGNIQLFTGSFFIGNNTGGSPINLAGVGFDNNIYFGDDGVATNIRLGNSAGFVRVSSGGRILINTSTDNLTNALQVAGSATFSSSVKVNSGTDAIDIGIATGNSYRSNLILRGTNASGVSSTSYFGVNVFSSDGSVDLTSDNNLIFRTGGSTERMRITSDGYARLSASSGGIQFNGDTAAANALDDYEEGTWTPTIGGTWTTNPTSLSGLYTKIGNMVYIRLEFVGGVKASTTSGWIDGLPFSGAVGGGGTVSNVSVQNRGIALLDNNTRVWLTELDFLGLSTKVMASYRL